MASSRLFNNIGRIGIALAITDGVINSMLYNDLQAMNITLRILYRPRAELLPKIFTNLGLDYEERVLLSITNEVLKSVVAQFDAIELITQRTLISQRVSELLTERAAQFSLLLDDISITHLSFRPEFTNAIELKQVAQQDVEKQRFLVEKTEQSRQANVITAKDDARAADLIGKALDEVGDEKEDQINNSLDQIKDSSTIEMMNFDNLFRRFILTQSFVRGWGNPFHLQEIFTYRPEKIGKEKGNQNNINARFRSPLAHYLPDLVPSQIATAHFQLVLSRDHGFNRRWLFTAVSLINQYPIGSILLENPYYGLRKPPDQSRPSLLYVTNLHIMGEVLVSETLMLLHWCQKMKLTSAILHDFSLSGHMA
ncbi:unnamed protein product [Rotaria sordida]|uniref:Band 7 domain-containing protein n=1 Tax=Rotaria sordida TaxID=392033 RepID=A0A819SAL0_9BILA|nr:unnamed protein product [Rotaria sordida]CAF1038310.1 unnamed protein product [Rotaria sordida]CAF4025890.1 unnamed protein product [Rotaria sordida]CAF4056408.1 unnamed protein product [Rotaria sordida]